jgi:hypothetical protein
MQTVKELLSCYHVEEETPDEDDPHNIHITEIGGEIKVEGPSLESKVYVSPIKVNKSTLGQLIILKWKVLETIGMNKQWKE